MSEANRPGGREGSSFEGRYFGEAAPAKEIPEYPMGPRSAYQIVRDELNLDGDASLNLASFVTTWMEPEAERLIHDAVNKNLIDQDEYPQTAAIEQRVVSMLASLYHAPELTRERRESGLEGPWGTATIGSSEAIMLALLAHKWAWYERAEAARKEGGEGPGNRPNVVMGADVHTCWEKFCRYFDVDMNIVELDPDDFVVRPERVRPLLNDGTIAVGAVVGTTFTGEMDDVEGLSGLLDEVHEREGWDIPLHVDAASGGFILPFIDGMERSNGDGNVEVPSWDFRLPRVKSINVSNHKFGLVYPGMGSVVFREKTEIPDRLFFDIDYLGGTMVNYSLNFSRGSSMVLAQYYNFLRLGREGYQRVMRRTVRNARYLADELEATGCLEAVNDKDLFPVVVVKAKNRDGWTVELDDLADELRKRGWIMPVYELNPNPVAPDDREAPWIRRAPELGLQAASAEQPPPTVMRMVVRENVSRNMCSLLVEDVRRALSKLRAAGRGATELRPAAVRAAAPGAAGGPRGFRRPLY